MKKLITLFKNLTFVIGLLLFTNLTNAQDYLVNFEGTGETKTAYASGTVKLSGLDWNMTEALIGTLEADWKNGLRSARLRGYDISSMTMLESKPNGIGTITFLYRRYGTDAQVDWKVEYSDDDGSTWIQIGSDFTAPNSDDVQTFEASVNVQGNIKVRIKRATETGTSNRRLNIDDILITDYNSGNPTVSTPVFSHLSGNYFSPFNLEITCSTPNSTIYYTTDGSDPDQSSPIYTYPFEINQTSIVKARAYADGFDPSFISQANYTFPPYTEVANLAALRAAYPSTDYFKVTGEVVVTFTQEWRNQKFVQDATGAILIDDTPGIITTNYAEGDGITGIVGTFTFYGEMLQFNPASDPGPATSTGNTIVPQVITISEMNTNFESYEAQLVTIENASFVDQGSTFINGTLYPITDNSDAAGVFRTTFYDVDYINTTVPNGTGSITGILNATATGNYITSRYLNDFDIIPTGPMTVGTIAEIRSGNLGQQYILSGEAVLTYQQSWRNQKFVQDATAAILLDDLDAVITTAYSIGDGITGISGTLVNHNGMLRLAVDADPGIPTSTNNTIQPELVTLAELNSGFMNYQAELVKIDGVTFADGGLTFQEGTNYPVSDESDASGIFRTEFYDADYLYTTIPSVPCDLIVIPITISNANYVTSRFASDIQPTVLVPTITVTNPNGYEYWEQGSTQNITWTSQDFTGNVKILLVRPGFYQFTIANDYPNSGFCEWIVPSTQTIANDYKIRIQGVNSGDPMDESDNYFSIVAELPIPDIVINEIMYNPSNSEPFLNDSYYEYLELYNNGNFNVDLSGWKITSAITHIFTDGTILEQGQYLVLAINADSVMNYYGITNVINWDGGVLNNTSETIELRAPDETLMDVVTYSDLSPWPTGADGSGSSLELIDPELDNSLPENWLASPQNLGTPGIVNSALGYEGLTVLSPNGGEIFEQGASTDITWSRINFNGLIKIELISEIREDIILANNIPAIDGIWNWQIPADLTTGDNYKIRISDVEDGLPTDESDAVFSVVEVIIPEVTILTPNGGEIIPQGTTFNITWNYANYDGLILIELITQEADVAIPLGTVSVTTQAFAWDVTQEPADNYMIQISDVATGEPSDQSDAIFSVILPPPPPQVIITEIMYNPPEGGTDSLEYIELYNMDDVAHNLAGWYFSKGVDFVFPEYTLNAGDYVVVAINAAAMLNNFSVNALQFNSGALGNGGEEVELTDAFGNVLDYVNFDDVAPWSAAPDGFGPSLSLIDNTLDNALAESWTSETFYANFTVGQIPVYGTPGAPNLPAPAQSILIPAGWGGVSSYIVPDQPNVSDVMQLLTDDITIMQNFNQIYFPFYNVNTIGNWNNNAGYQLKIENTRYLVIYGSTVSSKTVNLNNGWNSLPVLSECEVDAATLFGSVPSVIFVKEMGSNLIYWPDGGIFDLTTLIPGKAYFIKVNGATVITYPVCE